MKDIVKKIYGDIAENNKKKVASGEKQSCCCSNSSKVSQVFGYASEELALLPEGADMGLGCGNPVALASLAEGEVVVDLGSGGGIDVFLAAHRVGPRGKVIGIDMTESMIEAARCNAEKGGVANVEFRLGDIEIIPVEDCTVDCIISNCVINLARDKQQVFNEAYRILKPGGRLMVSDMVLIGQLPQIVSESAEMYAGCVAGALQKDDYLGKIARAGFSEVMILKEDPVRVLDYIGSEKVLCCMSKELSPEQIKAIDTTVVSVKVQACKPGAQK